MGAVLTTLLFFCVALVGALGKAAVTSRPVQLFCRHEANSW